MQLNLHFVICLFFPFNVGRAKQFLVFCFRQAADVMRHSEAVLAGSGVDASRAGVRGEHGCQSAQKKSGDAARTPDK